MPAPVELAVDKYSGAAGKSLERRAKPDPPRAYLYEQPVKRS